MPTMVLVIRARYRGVSSILVGEGGSWVLLEKKRGKGSLVEVVNYGLNAFEQGKIFASVTRTVHSDHRDCRRTYTGRRYLRPEVRLSKVA